MLMCFAKAPSYFCNLGLAMLQLLLPVLSQAELMPRRREECFGMDLASQGWCAQDVSECHMGSPSLAGGVLILPCWPLSFLLNPGMTFLWWNLRTGHWSQESRVEEAESLGPETELGRGVREEFACIQFTKCKMCHLVKFHRNYLYACCDSKRENRKEADIWERKICNMKIPKVWIEQNRELSDVPLQILGYSFVCWGSWVPEATATISP